ncbi:MAG TPA: ATP-binding protein [Mycobacteriales bacterium]|nr:ATP-binding protein [Mycobacteriales bacterium]
MYAQTQAARVELSADRTSARDARRFLVTTLDEWQIPEGSTDTACLLATELVTNAVLYAIAPIDLVVERWDSMLRVQVRDHAPQLPIPRERSDSLSLTGRGLALVKELSKSWGVTPRDYGKSVWFELSTAAQ